MGQVDADGVALAAIQGLQKRLERQQHTIEEQRARGEVQDGRIAMLVARLDALELAGESAGTDR